MYESYDVQPAPESRDEYEAALAGPDSPMTPTEFAAYDAWTSEQELEFMRQNGFDPFTESPEEFWARMERVEV